MEYLKKAWKYMEGKKSYLLGVMTATWNVISVFGAINPSPDQSMAVNGLFLALLGMSIRSGISKGKK